MEKNKMHEIKRNIIRGAYIAGAILAGYLAGDIYKMKQEEANSNTRENQIPGIEQKVDTSKEAQAIISPQHSTVDPKGFYALVASIINKNPNFADNFDYLPGMNDAKKIIPKKQEYQAPKRQPSEELYASVRIKNNNPGNIRAFKGKKWEGQVGSRGGFIVFKDLESGLSAMGRNLKAYNEKYGRDTITEIVESWAPKVENNTKRYISKVSQETGYHPNEKLNMGDKNTITNLIISMIRREHSKEVPRDIVEKSIRDYYN